MNIEVQSRAKSLNKSNSAGLAFCMKTRRVARLYKTHTEREEIRTVKFRILIRPRILFLRISEGRSLQLLVRLRLRTYSNSRRPHYRELFSQADAEVSEILRMRSDGDNCNLTLLWPVAPKDSVGARSSILRVRFKNFMI